MEEGTFSFTFEIDRVDGAKRTEEERARSRHDWLGCRWEPSHRSHDRSLFPLASKIRVFENQPVKPRGHFTDGSFFRAYSVPQKKLGIGFIMILVGKYFRGPGVMIQKDIFTIN